MPPVASRYSINTLKPYVIPHTTTYIMIQQTTKHARLFSILNMVCKLGTVKTYPPIVSVMKQIFNGATSIKLLPAVQADLEQS